MEMRNELDVILDELASGYRRAEAIEDGVLVDVSDVANEAGFRIAVAVTIGVWDECIAWTDKDSRRQTIQDEAGRLWDVLWTAYLAARHAKSNRCPFQLYRVPRGGHSTRPQLITLCMHIGGGDNGEPVITIMLAHED